MLTLASVPTGCNIALCGRVILFKPVLQTP